MITFTPVDYTPTAGTPCEGGRHGPDYLRDPTGDAYCARCGADMMGDDDDGPLVGDPPDIAVGILAVIVCMSLLIWWLL